MFDEFRKTWKEVTAKRPRPLSPGQCRVHETGIGMIADYLMQDGKRLGTRRVTSLDTAFVEARHVAEVSRLCLRRPIAPLTARSQP